MALGPEYQALIDSLTKQYQQNRGQAEASGIGEAQRRGLINPTGTSDIEMGLRQSKVAPIEQAYQQQVGQIGAQLAQDEANKKFQTSERLGGQEWQGGQAGLQRDWQGGQNLQNQGWQSGQNDKDRAMTQQQINMQNNQNDYRPSNWQSFIGGIIPGVGTGAGMGLAKKLFSDIRLKTNIKLIATLYEFEYKDNDVTNKLGINDGKKHVGLMAQEIEKVMPEAVSEKNGYKMIDYSMVMGA